jgi:hypothetical protein
MADGDTKLHVGDKVRMICQPEDAEAITAFFGHKVEMSDEEWGHNVPNATFISRRILITKPEINGKKFFVFGGAQSHDISEGILDRANFKTDDEFYEAAYLWRKTKYYYRIAHISWWKEELPSEDEMKHAMEQLAKHDFKVDYIISHCAPTGIHCLMGYDSPDAATNFLQQVAEKTEFKKWYFGHYHDDRNINPEFILAYNSILPIVDDRFRFSALGDIAEEPDEPENEEISR